MKKFLENAYMKIIHRVPSYFYGEKKSSKRKIKAIMLKYGHDEDYIENISDEFCQGFGVAKEIILKLIQEELEKRDNIKEWF